uniref:SAM-dependent methyltransferase n=1 Tax=Meloidogyne hapla TaxID=6305 RepID=A0A1I8AZJ3_MELHA
WKKALTTQIPLFLFEEMSEQLTKEETITSFVLFIKREGFYKQ